MLLKKLHSLGITKQELNWFEDYLSDRLQVVGYQNVLSEPELVTSGVPQGSIIGPLLFVLLVNDLPKVTSSCILLMYADDSVLFYSHIDFSGKTECLLSGTRAKLSAVNSFNITNKGRAITRVSEFKYLGVVLDECISWSTHVKHVISRAGKRVGILGRLTDNLTAHCVNTVYKSFIRPIIDYCDTVWTCCGKGNNDLIEKLQRRAARIVTKLNSIDKAMDSLKWTIIFHPIKLCN